MGALPDFFFFFPCSADHERDWPPCKVVFRVGNHCAEYEKQQQQQHSLYNSILLLPCYIDLFLLFSWCPSMAINVSVQYNGGLLPIILLTQCYYHRGTRVNTIKRFCICSLPSHLNVLTFFTP